jgi:hypothetical protein
MGHDGTRNQDCGGEGQQPFTLPTDRPVHAKHSHFGNFKTFEMIRCRQKVFITSLVGWLVGWLVVG